MLPRSGYPGWIVVQLRVPRPGGIAGPLQQSRAGTGESPAYSLGLGERPLAGHIEAVLFGRRPDIRAPTL